jgi:hypothetical protein
MITYSQLSTPLKVLVWLGWIFVGLGIFEFLIGFFIGFFEAIAMGV